MTQVAPWHRIHEVFHPTDGSPASRAALLHALRIAAAAGAGLTLMQIGPPHPGDAGGCSDVRGTLDRWIAQGAISQKAADIKVRWHAATGADPARSCLKSLERSPAELIVVATDQQGGKTAWLGQTIAEPLARASGEMTLLVPAGTAGFVHPEDGTLTLRNIVIPVARQPSPEPAIEAARRLMAYLPEADGTATLLHVGDPREMPELELPVVAGWKWERVIRSGEPVDTILDTAVEVSADLVAMTTQGRHGFLDALRGSTTRSVLRQARCPMLTMPVGSLLG